MNTKKTIKITGMLALSMGLLFAASQVDARGRHGGGMRGHGGPGMHRGMMGMLDLSSEQRTEMERLRLEMQQDTLELREQLRQKHEELRALWTVDEPSKKAILAKHRELEPLMKKLRDRRIDFRLAVHNLLTPEQRAQMAQMAKRGSRGMGGPGMGGPGMMGGGPGMMGGGPCMMGGGPGMGM